MARQPTSREWFLIAILVIAGSAVIYYQGGGGFGLGGGQADDRGRARPVGPPPSIDLARLNPTPEAYDPNGRSLFVYGPPPGRTPKPPPVRKPPPTPPPKADPPKPVARPPSIGFKYIGYLGPKTNKIAVFEDGDAILLARVGDVVQEKFRVVNFGYESVVMGYTDEKFKDKTTQLRTNAK